MHGDLRERGLEADKGIPGIRMAVDIVEVGVGGNRIMTECDWVQNSRRAL